MQSQTDKLYNLLKNGEPANTDTIIREVYPAEGRLRTPARISARIFDVKHKYGVEITSWEDKEIKGLWYYQIISKPPINAEYCATKHFDELHQPILFELRAVSPKLTVNYKD